jgi:integrase
VEAGFRPSADWLIVVLLLATGMRRGELLGLQIGDLDQRQPKLRIIRRADASEIPVEFSQIPRCARAHQ